MPKTHKRGQSPPRDTKKNPAYYRLSCGHIRFVKTIVVEINKTEVWCKQCEDHFTATEQIRNTFREAYV